jgi:hypothetical protein
LSIPELASYATVGGAVFQMYNDAACLIELQIPKLSASQGSHEQDLKEVLLLWINRYPAVNAFVACFNELLQYSDGSVEDMFLHA